MTCGKGFRGESGGGEGGRKEGREESDGNAPKAQQVAYAMLRWKVERSLPLSGAQFGRRLTARAHVYVCLYVCLSVCMHACMRHA